MRKNKACYSLKLCFKVIHTLKTIVECEKLKVSEVDLLKFFVNWAKYYAENNDVKLITIKQLLKNII